tara:strand:+ start:2585 stop:3562 length:978 start_codon:yes stop_codon:yes gene_type:complete
MKNKILITGGCGFIGSHLTEMFVKKGYNVIVFDRYNINNDYGWLNNSKYKKNIEFILGDIRDYDSVYNAVKNCSIVIHLAALIGIPYSYISPLAYIKTNIEGTYNILESSKKLNIDEIIVTSTSEVYGTAQYEPIDENHPHVAQSPYSASKIGADKISLSYYRSFNLPVKIIRPFNVFGPRQSLRAIIPTIINQLLISNTLKLGNLNIQRDFTYVLDLCNAYERILKNKSFIGKEINVGSNKNFFLNDIIEEIRLCLKIKKINIIRDNKRVRPKKSEVFNLICDNNFLKKNTNWSPNYSFKSGIKNTVNWYQKNKLSFDSKNYNV